MVGGPVPAPLERAIEAAIAGSDTKLAGLVEQSRPVPGALPLAVKYVPTKWAASYVAGSPLRISTTAGFTWGTGTYVTPLAFPLSSMIFGRVGVVAEFDPSGWKVFDATVPYNEALYLAWARPQPFFRRAVLTMHSAYYNQLLRNQFRTHFRIDCVLFPPDQQGLGYTAPSDVWMAVTDWDPWGNIADGSSGVFINPRLTVVAEEEFEDELYGLRRRALLKLTSSRPPGSTLQATIAQAYVGGTIVRVGA